MIKPVLNAAVEPGYRLVEVAVGRLREEFQVHALHVFVHVHVLRPQPLTQVRRYALLNKINLISVAISFVQKKIGI